MAGYVESCVEVSYDCKSSMIQLHVLPISFSFLPFFAAHNYGATDPKKKKKKKNRRFLLPVRLHAAFTLLQSNKVT